MNPLVPILLASTALQAYGMYKAGQDAKDIADRNQAALNQTAIDNQIIAWENQAIALRAEKALGYKGLREVELTRREIDSITAHMRTQEAITGFAYEGTPEWVAAESIKQGEEDVSTIWSNTVAAMYEKREEARIIGLQGGRIAGQLRTQGDITAQQGSYARTAGYYGGASALLQGGANAMYINAMYPRTPTTGYAAGG